MERGIREGATAVMEMENTAQDQSAFTEITLEAILSRENLLLALKRVEANKGAAGVDGMKTEELRKYICEHPGELTSAILSGKYRPAPVKRVTIPKPEKGKFRDLGILCNKPLRKSFPTATTQPFRCRASAFDRRGARTMRSSRS